MNERAIFTTVLWAWAALACVVFATLFRVTAPYGRHAREGWGPRVQSRWGWIVMEAPAPILFALMFLLGDRHGDVVAVMFLGLWLAHYLNRAFVFPLRMPGGDRPMPLSIVASALCFNAVNAYLNGRDLFLFGPRRSATWLVDPRFIVGVIAFVVGFAINLHADSLLRGLRAPGETAYKIPRGGLFRYVSCPNYLGEIIEWSGFALCTWSLAPLVFALWTIANLLPRALSHHAWYRATFADYPAERRALVPGLL